MYMDKRHTKRLTEKECKTLTNITGSSTTVNNVTKPGNVRVKYDAPWQSITIP